MVTQLLTILDPFSLGMSQFLCCQASFVLVLLSGIEHKPEDVGFDVGEPGNGSVGLHVHVTSRREQDDLWQPS